MYTIEEDKISVVPVDFNVFYSTAKEYKKNIRYSRDYTISESFFDELCFYVSNTSMCTGTELKIVSALINSKKAYLPYAAGIAKYKKDLTLCAVRSVDVLVDTGEMNIDYKLAGEEKYLD